MKECCMPKSYKHLNLQDRIEIQVMLQSGHNPAAIAAGLCRPVSCITRELDRNGWIRPYKGKIGRPRIAGGYGAARADLRANMLAARPRVQRKLVPGNHLWTKVTDGLRQHLSPEQIAGTMKRMNDPESLSHETIYQAIYAMPKGELRAEMIRLLRFGHKKRLPRSRGKDRRGTIPNMLSIDMRPEDIEERLVPGHWEGDLILGKARRSQVGTLVERKTLYVALAKLPNSSSEAVVKAFSKILHRFDKDVRRSLTYDQGKEMSQHEKLAKTAHIKVYFAHPHSPWERGINENTNGLLREFLPKGTDLSSFSQDQLDDIAWNLNTRPRKSLEWKCPAELFLPPGSFDFMAYWSAKLNPVALGP
jgi:IS30 family transposase